MKAPLRATRKPHPDTKKRLRAYSTFIYRAHKEGGLAGTRTVFLDSPVHYPRPVLLRLLGSEASRLSKTNRLRVITQQEINTAVTLVQQRLCMRVAA